MLKTCGNKNIDVTKIPNDLKMEGKSLALIEEMNGGILTYNEEVGQQLFLDPKISDCKVAILSIAGNERGGKSFLLNYILRYLDSGEERSLGQPDEELTGFDFRSGQEPTTHGINIWSEPYIKTLENGEKVAIFLMDTQGIYGDKSEHDSHIFALSIFASSLLIYNVQGNLLKNVLEPLDLMLRHTYKFFSDKEEKKFEKMMILVRDWTLGDKFGFHGGSGLLSERLTSPNRTEQYEFIRSCFKKPVSCFLMPSPGDSVTSPDFTGALSQLSPRFVDKMRELISSLIDDGLTSRHFTGESVNQYLKACLAAINDGPPLISATESYLEYQLSKRSQQIQHEFNDKLRAISDNISLRGETCLSLSNDFVAEREALGMEALQHFEELSVESKGPIYEKKLKEMQEELKTSFNAIEVTFLAVMCVEQVRNMKIKFGKELEDFINSGFMGYVFTKESSVGTEKDRLRDVLMEALKEFPELSEIFIEANALDFEDDKEKAVTTLRTNRRDAAIGAIFTIVFCAVSGGVAGAVIATASAARAVAGGIFKSTARIMARQVAKEGGKAMAGSVIRGSGTITSSWIKNIFSRNPVQPKEDEFKDHIGEMLPLLHRYLSVGGSIKALLNRAKETK